MALIQLKSDGFWIKKWIYDKEKGEGEYSIFKLDKCIFDMFQYFYDEIEIIGEVTFKNLIDAFNPKDLVVLGMLTGCNIDNFVHELSTDVGKDEDPIEQIIVEKYYEITNYTSDNRLTIQDDCTASGKSNINPEENYSLDFTNWWHYRNILIKISKEATFFDYRTLYTEEGKPTGSKFEKIETHITLLEFLTAIFSELGWWSSPQKRDSKLEELLKAKQEIAIGSIDEYEII